MGFTRQELESFRGATVPDLIGPRCRLLFVGINPGLWTAATQTHFAHPSNRFYPALLRSGVIEITVDRGAGMSDGERAHLLQRGVGITNLVARATARASELSPAELREGRARLGEFVERWSPKVVAVAGVTAFRAAFSRPGAQLGPQTERLSGAEMWVVPNPSGLNAHETVETLAGWYRAAAQAAGLALVSRPSRFRA